MKLKQTILSVVLLFAAAVAKGAPEADSRFDYYFIEAVNQGQQGHYAEAFDLFCYCLELDSTSAAVKYNLAQYYAMLGDRVKPGILMREAVAQEPDNYWYWQLLGNYYAGTHQYRDAVEVYEKMVSQFPTKPSIMMTLISLYEEIGDYRKGLGVLDRIEVLEGESMETRIQRFQLYLEMQDQDSAYLVIRDNVQWVVETFGPLVSNMSELNAMRSICRRAVVDFPNNLIIHYWNVLSEIRASNGQGALRALDAGIANITAESDSIDAASLYALKGDVMNSAGDRKQAIEAYSKAMELNPKDNMIANNYAYFLSLDRRDLKKAEKLSLRTITEEPLNATYLDTYAWILFNQKRYKEALVYILKAVQCISEPSPEVMEHCGDIHFKNGNTDEAVRYWNEAIDLGSESRTIEQKVIQKKYIDDEQDNR